MSGPGIVCAGCGQPTSWFKPVCDECAGAALADLVLSQVDTASIIDRAFTAHGDDAQAIVSQVVDELIELAGLDLQAEQERK